MSETIWGTISYLAPCGHWETRPQAWQLTVPLRAEDYPVLAEIWSGDEDDDIFTSEPAIRGEDFLSLAKIWENESDDAAFNDLSERTSESRP